jgi:hypothetical protein
MFFRRPRRIASQMALFSILTVASHTLHAQSNACTKAVLSLHNQPDALPKNLDDFAQQLLKDFEVNASFYDELYFWSPGTMRKMEIDFRLKEISDTRYQERFKKPLSIGPKAVLFEDRIYKDGFLRKLFQSGIDVRPQDVDTHPSLVWNNSQKRFILDTHGSRQRLFDVAFANPQFFRGSDQLEYDFLKLLQSIIQRKDFSEEQSSLVLNKILSQWRLDESRKKMLEELVQNKSLLKQRAQANPQKLSLSLIKLLHDTVEGRRGYRSLFMSRSERIARRWAHGREESKLLHFDLRNVDIPEDIKSYIALGIESAGAGPHGDIELSFFSPEAMLFVLQYLK